MFKENWFDTWSVTSAQFPVSCKNDSPADESPLDHMVSGIICGPNLRLINIDYQKKTYNGSILIVALSTDIPPVVEYRTGPAKETDMHKGKISNTKTWKAIEIHRDSLPNNECIIFYRYEFSLPLTAFEQVVKYSVNQNHRTHYRFFIPPLQTNLNIISYSCNGFSLDVDTSSFKGSLWFDILNKHSMIHYNVMLGGGDQIYSDSIKLYSDKVDKWLTTKNKLAKMSMTVDSDTKLDINNFYLKNYLQWFGYGFWSGKTPNSKTLQRYFPIVSSTIPSINIWDDHDIIDGFGSYHESLMKTNFIEEIGKSAHFYYMLFQHHTSPRENKPYLNSPHWILGANPGRYIGEKSHSIYTQLGPSIALFGLDCRTERTLKNIISPETYNILFQRLEHELTRTNLKHHSKDKIDHLLVMLGVPISYPRLVWLEWIFSSSLLTPLKYLSKKKILFRGLVNEFNGDVELLDDLNDHWCARYHKRERNFLVTKLQDISVKYGCRITILSGDVHLAALGRFRSKLHKHHVIQKELKEQQNIDILDNPEFDIRLMFNVISSAVVNAPPPDKMATLLQARAKIHHFDWNTDEDSVPIFKIDTNGKKRNDDAFLNKRNWSCLIPMENVLNNQYLNDKLNLKLGERILPGIVPDKNQQYAKNSSGSANSNDNNDEYEQKYPVDEKSLIASFHMETDISNDNGESTWYLLPIPNLQIQSDEKLSHLGVKHLNLK